MEYVESTITLLKESKFFYTIVVDMQGNYSYVSPNYDAHFSFTGETLIGKAFQTTLHPDDWQICAKVGEQSFKRPDAMHQATLRKLDGKEGYIYTHWEFRAIFNTNGTPSGIFCMGYNITEHVETQNLAEMQSEKLEEIVSIQSHDVRRPLANILGLIEMLDGTESLQDLTKLKAMLKGSAEELDLVIRRISDKGIS